MSSLASSLKSDVAFLFLYHCCHRRRSCFVCVCASVCIFTPSYSQNAFIDKIKLSIHLNSIRKTFSLRKHSKHFIIAIMAPKWWKKNTLDLTESQQKMVKSTVYTSIIRRKNSKQKTFPINFIYCYLKYFICQDQFR